MKEPFRERDTPRRIAQVEFGMLSAQEMRRVSHLAIVNRELYRMPDRQPMPYGVLDRRLGTSDKKATCETCKEKLADCVGHFGHIKFELPVFHIGYFKAIIVILQNICKSCSRVLLSEKDRQQFLRRYRTVDEVLLRRNLNKRLNDKCRRMVVCPYCLALNGPVKKIGPLKIIHEKLKHMTGIEVEEYHNLFNTAIFDNKDLKDHISKAQDDLNPLVVLRLFQRVTSEDCELLDLDPQKGRPERLILTYILVPPVCIRPSVAMDSQGSNEDDLTMKLTEIVWVNQLISKHLKTGSNVQMVLEDWDFLQLQTALYVNSEINGLQNSVQSRSRNATKAGKPMRGFCQRLKGKMGRFRGNLSGKRVDFSSRTVISPDPNLRIDQVAVPDRVAKILTYPQMVFEHNIEKMRRVICNGPDVHPGANFVHYTKQNFKRSLKYGKREKAAAELQVGDIVERHLDDGDVVLFNRQPSLHKMSIMCHRAKVMPNRTFRFNECVCGPYNADFDGDEMNLHLPQTEEARAEALTLMGVQANMVTPRNGEPLVAATQDFITATFLLTRKEIFLDRTQFMQLCSFMTDGLMKIDIPPPCILRPARLWTGKQVISVLIRHNKQSNVFVNVRTPLRNYTKQGEEMCPNDAYLNVRNSEILCGAIDKSAIGDGSKNTLFYILLRDFGESISADRMSRLAKLCARFLGNYGFSIGINDVEPSASLNRAKNKLVTDGYNECDSFISDYENRSLQLQAGQSAEETLEAKITGELSKIRESAGNMCFRELNRLNAPLIMAQCGSKGSKINISQMIACVGQQTVSGTRVPDGFEQRSLPHFERLSRKPAAKGFVVNSFFTGLTPSEFFFHTMGGREGLVDTAVKTAETGYMQRRLMKALEDLGTQYDYSVRNSVGGLIQFDYGDDRLDPAIMEAKDKPADLERVLLHTCAIEPDRESKPLYAHEIAVVADDILTGDAYNELSTTFRRDVYEFLKKKSEIVASKRAMHSLSPKKRGSSQLELRASRIVRITRKQLEAFSALLLSKYERSMIEPGSAVGAVGAQSIGEPGTQMTLKTFHFAGVASMNVTLGVPRIKEIINASKMISTPIIQAPLDISNDVKVARIVKGRIETTLLGGICESIIEVYLKDSIYLLLKLDFSTIHKLQLDVNIDTVRAAILATSKLKITPKHIRKEGKLLKILPPEPKRTTKKDKREPSLYSVMQTLKQLLPNVIISGIPAVGRAVINDSGGHNYELVVEGTDLRNIMATQGVRGLQTTSNHIIEVESTLGIEAARLSIMNEVQVTMKSHGMNIDQRHVMLLADLMTYKGQILGITRFGIAKMRDSVLMLASFEKTTDHLFDAALHSQTDLVRGVSECIIMGIPMSIGTGLFKLLHHLPKAKVGAKGIGGAVKFQPKPLLFDQPAFHKSIFN